MSSRQIKPLPSRQQSPRSPRLPQTNKKQLAQPEHLEKATNATRLQASIRRQLAQPEHLEKATNATRLQASIRRQLAPQPARGQSLQTSPQNTL